MNKYHEFCDAEHTRRGAWRGAFCAIGGVIHGFENSWGPWCKLDEDLPGLVYLQHLRSFFVDVVPFARLRSAPKLIAAGPEEWGRRASALATADRTVAAVYLPTGGQVRLDLARGQDFTATWFDPRTGDQHPAQGGPTFAAPDGQDDNGHPWDWALFLR